MTATIRGALCRTFDIRRGEGARVLLMFAYIFLVITALLIVKPTANAFFLTQFGVARLSTSLAPGPLPAASLAAI